MSDCLFCKIVNKEIPAEIVYQDDLVLAFNDISPQAKIHLLLIPKAHYKNILDMPSDLLSHMFSVIKKIVKEKKIEESGFRIVANTNSDGGQTVFHFHIHILAAQKLSEKMA